MLKIKLSRKGKKNQPFFRLIILEQAKDPMGDFLEDLGYYNPLTKKSSFKSERINYWISRGAKPTDSVNNLLISQGVIKGEKINVFKISQKKKKIQGEKATALAAAQKSEKKKEIKEESQILEEEKGTEEVKNETN